MQFIPSKYHYLLFDLDGTLTDSGEGIINCVRYALQKCNMPVLNENQLRSFIGPPLLESFQSICGMTSEQAIFAVSQYRKRFASIGMYENTVYDGIPALLQQFTKKGYVLAVATSKPEVFAKKILKHFGLLNYFTAIAGSDIHKVDETKADVIKTVLQRLGITNEILSEVVMIGDRKYDIIGAKTCGIPCVGVSYGYAPEGELEKYQADKIVLTVNDLKNLFMSA